MPRLTNSRTGVVVNVSDDTAARLGGDWKKPEPKKAAKPAEKQADKK